MSKQKIFKKTSLALLYIFSMALLLSGCTNYFNNKEISQKPETVVRTKDKKREIIISKAQNVIVVYYATPDGKNLLPVTLDVNPTEEMAKVSVEKLLARPSDNALENFIPEGTKLKDLYKFENIAYVDLTKEFLKAKNNEAKMAVEQLVFTLTEFQQVDSIQILINGRVPTEPYGDIDITKTLHRPRAINFYGRKAENVYKVYYPDANALYMIPLTFATNHKVTPELVVERLLEDPPEDSGLGKSPIWQGTKNLGIEVKDSVAYVNLSKEALGYGGGAANESNLVNSLTFTLTELPEINKVQLLIEGKKPEYLPEGTDTTTPWQKPEKINYFQK